MKLDKDCVRDILLFAEDYCQYYDHPQFGRQLKCVTYILLCESEKFSNYDKYVIYYAISKLFEGKYVLGYVIPKDAYSNFNYATIEGLSLKGHDLLDNIRPETVWQETKSVLQKVGDFSLGIMSQVAGETMAAYTKAMMSLN